MLTRKSIQRTHGFVHQQECWVVGQRARNAYTLLHAARQFINRTIGIALKPDQCEFFLGHGLTRSGINATQTQPQGHVVAHIEPRHEGVLLEHHSTISAGAINGPPIQQDVAG